MKRDQDKTKEQLINELEEMQKRAVQLETHESEYKRLMETLGESEEKYRALVEDTLIGIMNVDITGKITYVNQTILQGTGYSLEEMIDKNVFRLGLFSGETIRVLRKRMKERLMGQPPGLLEIQFKRKDGEWIWLHIRGRVLWKHNIPVGIQIIGDDITERRQAEEKLWKSEERFRTIYENAPVLIDAFDKNGRCVLWNKQCHEIFGWTIDEINAHDDALALFYPNPAVREEVKQTVTTKPDGRFREWHPVTKAGKTLTTMWANFRLPDGMAFNLGYDITMRKQAEEKQMRTEKLESIGTLAGGIAHDFNNILTGIMGNIGLAKRYVEPKSKAEERLLEAEKASLRARDLTQQLLTFARGGAPIKQIASITELLEESATFALRGSNIRCEFSLADNLWSVEVDEGQMNQVITNLVINADEAMPEEGILNIGARNSVVKTSSTLPLPEGNYVEITIEDHGIGISREHLSKIFDPYFTTKQKGSGLGLSTAYSIVKNHEGYITAKSKLGVGTTFHIYLPASEKPIPVEKEEVAETAAAGKGRILVMDDEEIVRALLHDELTDFGYEVELTDYGAEAVERYKEAKKSEKPFDAVILDLTVPGGMGGKEVIKKLLEIDPDVKAIVSSGYSTDPIMSDFREYGFSAVVAKPYTMEQLERTLRSILLETGE
ncbi:MAG TPA: PAS domain S-box protein [Dehalococcoidia bacterium]|nr:PAS domain S-box protein [Dehalococcoidia bacterium]